MPPGCDHLMHVFVSQKTKDILRYIARQRNKTSADVVREILSDALEKVDVSAMNPMQTDGPHYFC